MESLTNNKQWAACHSQAHTVNLAETLNADIPVYEGFNWSQPMYAAIFNGEPWIPDGFTAGEKVMFSNRRSNVNGDAVFDFYNDTLTGKGWVLEQQTLEANPFAGYIAWLGLTMALAVGGIFLPTSESKWLFESAFIVNLSGTVMSPLIYFRIHKPDHRIKVILITLVIAFSMGLFIVLAAATNSGNGY